MLKKKLKLIIAHLQITTKNKKFKYWTQEISFEVWVLTVSL